MSLLPGKRTKRRGRSTTLVPSLQWIQSRNSAWHLFPDQNVGKICLLLVMCGLLFTHTNIRGHCPFYKLLSFKLCSITVESKGNLEGRTGRLILIHTKYLFVVFIFLKKISDIFGSNARIAQHIVTFLKSSRFKTPLWLMHCFL